MICLRSTTARLHLDLAQRDARNVEQIVDQPRELRRLTSDDISGLDDRLVRRLAHLYDLGRERDRGQRIAQLVGQHRQELVLAPIDVLKRLGHAHLCQQLAVFLFGALPLRDHLGEHDDAADLAPGVAPRANLPAGPVGRSVAPDEEIVLVDLDGAREATAVDLLPALGELRKNVVVAPAEVRPGPPADSRSASAGCR